MTMPHQDKRPQIPLHLLFKAARQRCHILKMELGEEGGLALEMLDNVASSIPTLASTETVKKVMEGLATDFSNGVEIDLATMLRDMREARGTMFVTRGSDALYFDGMGVEEPVLVCLGTHVDGDAVILELITVPDPMSDLNAYMNNCAKHSYRVRFDHRAVGDAVTVTVSVADGYGEVQDNEFARQLPIRFAAMLKRYNDFGIDYVAMR